MDNIYIQKFDIVIIGGGAGGLASANRLQRKNKKLRICLVENEESHQCAAQLFYGLLGKMKMNYSSKLISKIIPNSICWIKKRASKIDPDHSFVILNDMEKITYKVLIVATGAVNRFDLIDGYEKEKKLGRAVSIYDCHTHALLKTVIESKNLNNIVFSYPKEAVKCPGVTFKLLFLWNEKSNSQFQFFTGRQSIFPIPYYANLIKKQLFFKNINSKFNNELIAIDDNNATFGLFDRDQLVEKLMISYDIIHVTPSVTAPNIITESPLVDSTGNWLEVDSKTLQHVKYKNVFGVGDVCSTSNTKTSTAAFYQAKVCAENIVSFLNGQTLESQYDGFSLCPLILQSGRALMAQFNYQEFPIKKLPLLQPRSESRFNWLFVKYIYPYFYWNFGIKGKIPF